MLLAPKFVSAVTTARRVMAEARRCCVAGSSAKVKAKLPLVPKPQTAEHQQQEGGEPSSSSSPPIMTLEQEQLLELQQEEESKSGATNLSASLAVLYNVGFMEALLYKFAGRSTKKYSEEVNRLITGASSRLYHDAANRYNFIALHREFGLHDNFYTWYRLTLLHMWMVMARVQQSLESYAYCFLRRQMIMTFHKDKTNRYNTHFRHDEYARLKRYSKFQHLYYGIFMPSLLDYDEGFLGDDRQLAGAVWRSLFELDQDTDVVHLNRAVRYIRQTMHYLDGLDTEQMLLNGVGRWQPADEILQAQEKKEQQLKQSGTSSSF